MPLEGSCEEETIKFYRPFTNLYQECWIVLWKQVLFYGKWEKHWGARQVSKKDKSVHKEEAEKNHRQMLPLTL